jgi:hypothetical protein
MAIIQNPILFLSLIAVVVFTQVFVFYTLKKTNQIFVSLLPNVGLFLVGIILSFIGYVVALNEPGSWAGLGLIILLMLTLIVTTISSLVSLFLVFLMITVRPANSNKV